MKDKSSRRDFIQLGLKTGVALPFLTSSVVSCNTKNNQEAGSSNDPKKKLKILILGGTSFLGPHQIAYAMSRGHAISTFTRGKTLPTVHQGLFNNVERLIGDRNDNLTALHNRKWDVVIDNSGRDVKWTRDTAELLKENCDLYLYTSSTGVYYPYLESDIKEDAELVLTEPEGLDDEATTREYWYGVMKANSELEAIKHFGKDRVIVVRPTYMIGPADKTNRFIHWPIRLSRGGEVLVPGKKNDMVQYADVRDVAEWMIRLAEERKTGTYNAVGPKEKQDIYSFVNIAKNAFNVETSFVTIDDYEFLKQNDITYIVPWIKPIGNNQGSAKISNTKALENGLLFRSLSVSVKDTLDWWNSDSISQEQRDLVEQDPKSILVREKSILDKWKSR